jgi:hypothetical protein
MRVAWLRWSRIVLLGTVAAAPTAVSASLPTVLTSRAADESQSSATLVSFECSPPDQVFACDAAGCDGGSPVVVDSAPGCLCFDPDANTLISDGNLLDHPFQTALGVKEQLGFPLEIAGWHWWAIDTTGAGNGGYGFRNYRGTYAYTLRGGPEYQIDKKQSVGAYGYFAMRDGDHYRTYYTTNFWFLEGYGWYRHADLGTLKAGLVFTRFGLDGYGNFIGTAPYFEGYIQDPDYGLSWENTWNVRDDLAVDTFAQFFFHEDGKNGSLRNFDSESVARINERNTAVLRSVGKWTLQDASHLDLGVSFLIGQIDSHQPGFSDDVRTVWGVDMTYTNGPFGLKGEFLQRFGRVVPTHFVSGGPSDRMEAWSSEASFKTGPLTWRGKYSQSFLSNPGGGQDNLSLGWQLDVTANVHFFAEYLWWNVDGNATAGDFTVIEGPQLTIYWHY